jgi:hypothetical protein
VNPQEKGPLTFLFVHGFLDDAAVWRPLIAALHTPDSQSRAVDLAGTSGRPREAGPYTLGRYANDVIDVIECRRQRCGATRTASASEPALPGTGVGPHQRSGRTDRGRRDSRVR